MFVDSTGVDSTNDSGPHERFAVGILYDNITCDNLNVRQRLWKGSGQGWAGRLRVSHFCYFCGSYEGVSAAKVVMGCNVGAFHVVYNCTARNSGNCFQDAPGTTNWILGFKGGQAVQPEFHGQATRVMSLNASVEPRSLYWAQLTRRMGGDECLMEATVGSKSKRHY